MLIVNLITKENKKYFHCQLLRIIQIVGLFTVICWLTWGVYNRKKMKYVWKVQLYVILIAMTTLLELVDIPPILWTFDCHSIWHLSTSPLHILFYR